jgi:hypothetical protein
MQSQLVAMKFRPDSHTPPTRWNDYAKCRRSSASSDEFAVDKSAVHVPEDVNLEEFGGIQIAVSRVIVVRADSGCRMPGRRI